jgi:UDP-N-acetylglucosamine diphosphorylase/glucosamine-1-phosphate N-acetyltransferase
LSEHEVAKRLLPENLLSGSNVVLFEDDSTGAELFPLSVLRPAWEIRCGAGCLRRWLALLKLSGLSLLFRPRANLVAMSHVLADCQDDIVDPDAHTVFLNGRLIGLWGPVVPVEDWPQTVVDDAGRVLLARRRGAAAQALIRLPGNELASRLVQESKGERLPDGWSVRYARYVWDYMLHNREMLERELAPETRTSTELLGGYVLRELPSGVLLTDRAAGYPVCVGSGAKIMAGVVIGNHAGVVWIGPQTEIEPHTYLEGPLFVGPNCRVKSGARLRGGCSLGPHCRVAGEISSTVMQGYVNKQHDGFLGNSLLGPWVNLGADTVVSNLRNDYATVKVHVHEHLVDSGEMHIGLMCGDHTKTGINTMFNTGTVVGVAANVYGADYPPRFIPSFMWGGTGERRRGDLVRVLNTARAAMQRRGCDLTSEEENLLREHYAESMNQEIIL